MYGKRENFLETQKWEIINHQRRSKTSGTGLKNCLLIANLHMPMKLTCYYQAIPFLKEMIKFWLSFPK